LHLVPVFIGQQKSQKEIYFYNYFIKTLLEQKLGYFSENLKLINGKCDVHLTGLGDISINIVANQRNALSAVSDIVKYLNKLSISQEEFEIIKSILIGKKRDIPYELATFDSAEFIRSEIRNYSLSKISEDDLGKANIVGLKDYLNHIHFKLENLYLGGDFENFKLDSLVSKAVDLFKDNSKTIFGFSKALVASDMWISLSERVTIKRIPPNGMDTNICIIHYQLPSFDVKSKASVYLIRTYLKKRFFEYMRGQENPEYFMDITSIEKGLQFTVYSSTRKPEDLKLLIEGFINQEYNRMDLLDLWNAKKTHIKRASWLNYLGFEALNEVFWRDTITPEYGASDREDTLKKVKSAKLSEVKDFFHTMLINDVSKKTLVLITS